ncbi:cytochrome p450 monooxygenase [Xylariomycetidae sp. FL0641]|nr:cytochrome p450 monooxygenase [Xylariomycetidae sp. FL0641]
MLSLMLTPTQGLLLTALVTSALYLLYSRVFRARSPYPLPPGPPGRFLLGNAGQLSDDHPDEDYIRWGKEYNSDIIYTKVLGQHMISLNSLQACTDLLDRRGANYCDRPRFTLFEVMGWGLTLTFLRWGPRFKLHRRLFQSTFSQSAVKVFRPAQQQEARKAVRTLVSAPGAWEEATLLMATSLIFRIAFGQAVRGPDSPYCAMAAAAAAATANGGIAGATLVDVFPPARFLPAALCPSPALRHARASRPAIVRVHDAPWAAQLADLEAGRAGAEASFMRTHLEALKGGRAPGMEADDVKGAAAAVFIAGGNSTWGTVLSCMLFLTKYPAEQAAVCEALDAVLLSSPDDENGKAEEEGGGAPRPPTRLPTFDDRPALGALDDFVMETMRALPLNPLVIPHRALREDVYRGYRIPAGTTVFANTTAVTRDPGLYAEPRRFDPARYRAPRAEPYPAGNFGYGRRRCPGNHLALATVWMFLATLLAVFRLEMQEDAEGNKLEPQPGVTFGLGGHPKEFACRLVVRNRALAKVLLAEGEGEEGEGEEGEGEKGEKGEKR